MDTGSWFGGGFAHRPLGEPDLESLARPSILIVEDDPDILELLVFLLEQVGCTCVSARTAEAGLAQLREATFDLVLADYSLPARSAAWMLGQASEEGLLSSTPVLIVTSHPDPHGIDGFEVIRKPFDLDRLVGRVKQRLEGGTPPARTPRSGRPAERSPRRGDDREHGTRKPIELVLYISAHSPRSATTVENIKRALARFEPSRVQLTIYDLAREPMRGVTDSVAFTPTLVKRSPGPRTFILGHLSSPELLLELIEGCDS